MSHEIEQMAYIGQTPWHGLGNRLTEGADLETWRREAGLDWEVRESDVFYYAEPTVLRSSKTRKVLYRSDSLEPLSVVSNRYKAVQPGQILEFYRDLVSDFGFEIETAGSLKGGLKVWALANTKNAHILRAQEELQAYLLLATSYDATFATTAQFTGVCVVCNNTLQMAFDSASGQIKIGHRDDFNEQEVKAQLGLSRETFDRFTAATEALTRVGIDAAKARAFYRDVMQVSRDDSLVKPREMAEKNMADTFTRNFTENRYIGSDLEVRNGTAWGLVNVVTEYLDHVRRQSVVGSRFDSAQFGRGAVIKNRAFKQALELV
jgi:phage/plasmid-like protein (TIGR03299 family)